MVKIAIIKPDIVRVMESEGVELRQHRRDFWCKCPLHGERTASFKINTELQQFFCFGCKENGDVIHFIQKLKNLDFKQACGYLGIKLSGKNQPFKPNTEELRKKRILQNYKKWCANRYDYICGLSRTLEAFKLHATSMDVVEQLAEFYNQQDLWEYEIDILSGGDELFKIELYEKYKTGGL